MFFFVVLFKVGHNVAMGLTHRWLTGLSLAAAHLQAAASAADLQNPMIGFFDGLLLEMGVWVHPQYGFLCGAAVPGVFFSKKNMTFAKHIYILIIPG